MNRDMDPLGMEHTDQYWNRHPGTMGRGKGHEWITFLRILSCIGAVILFIAGVAASVSVGLYGSSGIEFYMILLYLFIAIITLVSAMVYLDMAENVRRIADSTASMIYLVEEMKKQMKQSAPEEFKEDQP